MRSPRPVPSSGRGSPRPQRWSHRGSCTPISNWVRGTLPAASSGGWRKFRGAVEFRRSSAPRSRTRKRAPCYLFCNGGSAAGCRGRRRRWTISITAWSGAASTPIVAEHLGGSDRSRSPIHDRVCAPEGHGMTFAELMILFLVGFLLYLVLKPLRLRIERTLLRFFGRSVRSSGRVIDITPNRKTER